eukprot:2458387-Amphidinium_carterae.1
MALTGLLNSSIGMGGDGVGVCRTPEVLMPATVAAAARLCSRDAALLVALPGADVALERASDCGGLWNASFTEAGYVAGGTCMLGSLARDPQTSKNICSCILRASPDCPCCVGGARGMGGPRSSYSFTNMGSMPASSVNHGGGIGGVGT